MIDRFANAFDTDKKQPQAQRNTPAPVVKQTTPVAPEPERQEEPLPPARPVVARKTKQQSDIPTAVQQIIREDVPLEYYGVKPVQTNFGCYNKELWKWLKEFSSENRFNGGVPITKSQLMEICLDVVMYDLDINPIGYESQQQLREDIQNRIRQRT